MVHPTSSSTETLSLCVDSRPHQQLKEYQQRDQALLTAFKTGNATMRPSDIQQLAVSMAMRNCVLDHIATSTTLRKDEVRSATAQRMHEDYPRTGVYQPERSDFNSLFDRSWQESQACAKLL